MKQKREVVDLFVDESHFTLPSGKPLLIYAAVDVYDPNTAAAEIAQAKATLGLAADMELKWNTPGGDPEVKARAKEAFLSTIAGTSASFIACSEGTDKTAAFLNLLDTARELLVPPRRIPVRFVCDEDAFRSRNAVGNAIADWPAGLCRSVSTANSAENLGIQFADLVAGSFRYRLACRFGSDAKRVTVFHEHLESEDEYNLDELFRIMTRWTFWGGTPLAEWNGEGDFTTEHATLDCFGTGITLHGSFSESEVAGFRELCVFYRGCMS